MYLYLTPFLHIIYYIFSMRMRNHLLLFSLFIQWALFSSSSRGSDFILLQGTLIFIITVLAFFTYFMIIIISYTYCNYFWLHIISIIILVLRWCLLSFILLLLLLFDMWWWDFSIYLVYIYLWILCFSILCSYYYLYLYFIMMMMNSSLHSLLFLCYL